MALAVGPAGHGHRGPTPGLPGMGACRGVAWRVVQRRTLHAWGIDRSHRHPSAFSLDGPSFLLHTRSCMPPRSRTYSRSGRGAAVCGAVPLRRAAWPGSPPPLHERHARARHRAGSEAAGRARARGAGEGRGPGELDASTGTTWVTQTVGRSIWVFANTTHTYTKTAGRVRQGPQRAGARGRYGRGYPDHGRGGRPPLPLVAWRDRSFSAARMGQRPPSRDAPHAGGGSPSTQEAQAPLIDEKEKRKT